MKLVLKSIHPAVLEEKHFMLEKDNSNLKIIDYLLSRILKIKNQNYHIPIDF